MLPAGIDQLTTLPVILGVAAGRDVPVHVTKPVAVRVNSAPKGLWQIDGALITVDPEGAV